MRVLWIAFILMITPFSVHSIEGELSPAQSTVLDIEEGALFNGVIRLWNLPAGWEVESLRQLEDKEIGKNFHLVKIKSIEKSQHNSDVVELNGLFALIKAISSKEKLTISLGETPVTLELRRLNTIATAPPAKDFELIKQEDYTERKINFIKWSSILIGMIVVAAMILLIPKLMKIRQTKKIKKEWLKKIEQAQTREKIEELGKHTDVLRDIFKIPDEQLKSFMAELNDCQYRKEWSEEQLQSLRGKIKSVINV